MSLDRKVFQVANFFIKKGIEEGKPLTHMKAQKLVYFTHAWNLAINDSILSSEGFEAWEYGPVNKDLYNALKSSKSFPITNSLLSEEGKEINFDPDMESIKDLSEKIWEQYGKKDAIQLSQITHLNGSPWEKTYMKGHFNKKIDNNVIKNYYKKMVNHA